MKITCKKCGWRLKHTGNTKSWCWVCIAEQGVTWAHRDRIGKLEALRKEDWIIL